jgi:lipoyl(octanoyl) transferase
MAELTAYDLGLVDYRQAFDLQERLLQEKLSGTDADVLLLLEHPPTLTLGKRDDLRNLLVPESEIRSRGVAIAPTDRGGSITWHGPGQLVVYPIVDLTRREMDVHKYIRDLEEVIIRTLADFSISASRDEDHVGVWVGPEKVAAIGVKIRRWITKHGFAINVNSDLTTFSLINPCGIADKGVTSIAGIRGHDVSMETVRNGVMRHFSDVFGMYIKVGSPDEIRNAESEHILSN